MPARSLIFLAVAASAILACSAPPERPPVVVPPAAPKDELKATGCLTIIGTNDHHGSLEPQIHHAGPHEVRAGGLLTFSAYLRRLREELGDTIVLVDGGDIYQGSLLSDHFEGAPTIEALSILGYDAAAVGNHEFDFGPGVSGGEDRLAVVKRNIAAAKFPFLGLNIVERQSGKRPDWPNLHASVVKEVAGIKVGITAVSTVETPRTTKGQNVVDLQFEDPARLVMSEAKALRERGAQIVILVGHIGSNCTDIKNPNDVSSCDNTSELFTLLERLPPGTVDVAVGGHTHQFIAHWVHGVATIESGSHARRFGRIDACLSAKGGLDLERTVIHSPTDLCLEVWKEGGCRPRDRATGTEPVTFLGKPLEPMPELVAALQPYIAKITQLKEQKLGVLLPKPMRRDEELGPFVAEALARHAKTALALENIGGVRDDLPGGELTFGQVYRVLPFGNRVTVMQLTGAQLKSAVRVLYDKRRAPPYLHGLTFVRRDDGSVELLLNGGTAVTDDGVYDIATNDFLAKGGDGIDVAISTVTDAQRRFLDMSDRDAFIQLLKERFPLKQP